MNPNSPTTSPGITAIPVTTTPATTTPVTTLHLEQLENVINALLASKQQQEACHLAQANEINALRNQLNQRLPTFKNPSAKPPSFAGKSTKIPAYELQTQINNFLETSLDQCEFHNLATEPDTVIFPGQSTYVKWVSSGLTDHARNAWLQIPREERNAMSWDFFVEWVNETFGSELRVSKL
jgi:hypothetical protein